MDRKLFLEQTFNLQKQYVGRAFATCRFYNCVEIEDLVLVLQEEKYEWPDVSASIIENVELHHAKITYAEFKKICSALGETQELVLRRADFQRGRQARPKAQIAKELLEEPAYEMWRGNTEV